MASALREFFGGYSDRPSLSDDQVLSDQAQRTALLEQFGSVVEPYEPSLSESLRNYAFDLMGGNEATGIERQRIQRRSGYPQKIIDQTFLAGITDYSQAMQDYARGDALSGTANLAMAATSLIPGQQRQAVDEIVDRITKGTFGKTLDTSNIKIPLRSPISPQTDVPVIEMELSTNGKTWMPAPRTALIEATTPIMPQTDVPVVPKAEDVFSLTDRGAAGMTPNMVDYQTANILDRNPNYFKEWKDVDYRIMNMSPDEYLERAGDILKSEGRTGQSVIDQRARNTDYIKDMAESMLGGQKYAAPFLDYGSGGYGRSSQEGIHRALSAKQLGMDEIPVMVLDSYENPRSPYRSALNEMDTPATNPTDTPAYPKPNPIEPARIRELSADTQTLIDEGRGSTGAGKIRAVVAGSSDIEFASEVLGEALTGNNLNPASDAVTRKTLAEIKEVTQESLKDMPDEVTVYRYGGIDAGGNSPSNIKSFTLNPNYSGPLFSSKDKFNFDAYTVNKKDIEYARNAFFPRADEAEVLIRNDKVRPTSVAQQTDVPVIEAATPQSALRQIESPALVAPQSALREIGGPIPEVTRDTSLMMRVGDVDRVNSMNVDMTAPEVASAPILNAEDLEGRAYMSGITDTTRPGLERVMAVNGTELAGSEGVPMRGGFLWGFQPEQMEAGHAFSSAANAVTGQMNRAKYAQSLSGREGVVFAPHGMVGPSPDFATQSTEIAIPYARQNMSDVDKRFADIEIEKVVPGWVGIDRATPEYMASLGGKRKKVLYILDKDFRDAGALSLSQIRAIITEPSEFGGDWGAVNAMYLLNPEGYKYGLTGDSSHPAYPAALLGEPLGVARPGLNILDMNPSMGASTKTQKNFIDEMNRRRMGQETLLESAVRSGDEEAAKLVRTKIQGYNVEGRAGSSVQAALKGAGGFGVFEQQLLDEMIRRGLINP